MTMSPNTKSTEGFSLATERLRTQNTSSDPDTTASDLQARLFEHEIYLLPGTFFHWDEPARGEEFVRIASGRPQSTVNASPAVV